MSPEVLCIGHAAYDISVFVDGFPEENSKCETTELLEAGGGPAANAAYLLSSWAIPCAFGGLVGADQYGEYIRRDFCSVGTDVTLLESRPGHGTPLSLIFINKQNGSRTIVNRKAKTARFTLDAKQLAGISPKILLLDGHEFEASCQALAQFPDAVSILDAGSWREGTAKLAPRVNYLAASERFALQASGISSLADDQSRRRCAGNLSAQYPAAKVIVTLGEEGLFAQDETGFRHIPAYPAHVVDTTAAGDVFHGALAYALLQSNPMDEALRFASMAASLSVQKVGGRQSIPRLSEVQQALTHAG